MMRAITIHQPYATLIMEGEKREEYRSWKPPENLIGDWLAIHSSAEDWDVDERTRKRFPKGKSKDDVFPRGAVLGAVRVTGVRWDEKNGCYAWKLEDPFPLEEPYPKKGTQRLWNIDELEPPQPSSGVGGRRGKEPAPRKEDEARSETRTARTSRTHEARPKRESKAPPKTPKGDGAGKRLFDRREVFPVIAAAIRDLCRRQDRFHTRDEVAAAIEPSEVVGRAYSRWVVANGAPPDGARRRFEIAGNIVDWFSKARTEGDPVVAPWASAIESRRGRVWEYRWRG